MTKKGYNIQLSDCCLAGFILSKYLTWRPEHNEYRSLDENRMVKYK